MTDLIKREDALAAIDTFKRDFEQSWKVQFSADIKALPAVTTHRYAGESEASVYDRKGFPPIEIVNDPAAVREAALQARIEELVKERDDLGRKLNTARYGQPDFAWSIHEEAMADLRAKLAKAKAYLQKISRHANRSCAAIAAHVLAELEKE